MKIVKKQIKDLTPATYNPRKDLQPGDKEYEQLKRSVQEYGYVEPVIFNRQTGIVVGGHQRLKVLEDLGYTEVECVEVDIDSTKEKALNVALNKISGEWDELKLRDLLQDLQGLEYDLELTGFTVEDLDELGLDTSILDTEDTKVKEDKQVIEDDFDPLADIPKRVQTGDLWKLGDHLLYCGDSLDSQSYKTLMGEEVADLVFTDPPYGMKKEKDGVENDNLNYDDLLEFNKVWIPLTFEYLKGNGSWYCWGIDEPLMDIYSHILKPMKKKTGMEKLTFRNLITWDKGVAQGRLSPDYRMYPIADEKCLFVMLGRQTYGETKADYWDGFEPIRQKLIALKDQLGLSTQQVIEYAGATTCSHWFALSQWEFPNENTHWLTMCNNLLQSGRIDREEYDKIREEYDKIREEWYKTRAYFDNTHDNMTNVWNFERTSSEERALTGGHATPKPIALCARAIKSSSRDGEIVLDVFGGSGSTLIACEQLGRKCRMIELTEHYCDVIINRWEVLTGKKAEKVG